MTITTKREIGNIVLTRKPIGMFYADNDGAGIVACDNSTGDAWIADFPDTESAMEWLRDGPRTGYTQTEENCRGCMGPCGACAELEEVVRWAHGIANSLSKNTSFSEEQQEVFAVVRDGIILKALSRLGLQGRCKASGAEGENAGLKKRIRELEEALRMGIEMRDGQKMYFRTREGGALDAARAMERAFDKTAAAVLDEGEVTVVKGYGEMPTLFPA